MSSEDEAVVFTDEGGDGTDVLSYVPEVGIIQPQ